LITLSGIIGVAVLVFGGLWLFARLGDETDPPDSSTVVVDSTASSTTATQGDATTLAEPPSSSAPDSTVVAETPPPTTTVRAPSEIRVQVLNSVGTTGIAADASAALEAAGYQVVEPDNYDPLLDRSLVLFRDGFGPEAFELAAFFPDAQVGQSEDLDEGVDVLVLLGSSYEPE
jgi:hypothetical protein